MSVRRFRNRKTGTFSSLVLEVQLNSNPLILKRGIAEILLRWPEGKLLSDTPKPRATELVCTAMSQVSGFRPAGKGTFGPKTHCNRTTSWRKSLEPSRFSGGQELSPVRESSADGLTAPWQISTTAIRRMVVRAYCALSCQRKKEELY